MRTVKFEFENQLNKRFEQLNLGYDDIVAIDIYVLKDYDDKIKETMIYQLPVVHTYDDVLEFINKVNTESTVFKTNIVNFFISGTIWFNDNTWMNIEEDEDDGFFYFEFRKPLPIQSDLYDIKSINCKKTIYKPNNLKSFNELIGDYDTERELDWVTKRSIYKDNFISGIFDCIVKENNTFDLIKNVIKCACIQITTDHKKTSENFIHEEHVLVLKQNYTEKEFVEFLLSLNVYGNIISSSASYIWLESGRECWSYEKTESDSSDYDFDWKYKSLPAINKRCLNEEK